MAQFYFNKLSLDQNRIKTMFRKVVSVLIVLVLVLGLASAVHGDLSVGVKKGDWIEYAITTTGTPSEGHDIDWSRMEVTDIQGTNIIVYITSRFINGSTENFNSTLNLKTGHLIDDFIIPANLKSGDTFLDEKVGNVTITSSEQALLCRSNANGSVGVYKPGHLHCLGPSNRS